MRGSNTLFNDVFVLDPTVQRKGRSETLIAQRNNCLIDRYFYYGKFFQWRYDKILNELSKEFFLSEVTIPKVMDENYEYLSSLKKEQPSKNSLSKKWPHLVWD